MCAPQAPTSVTLKVGAQVMLTKNVDMSVKLVNGSRGVVVGFNTFGDPKVDFGADHGSPLTIKRAQCFRTLGSGAVFCRSYYPVKLAYAITVHKAQGATLSRVVMDVRDAFDYGQVYVALSRVRGLEGVWLEGEIDDGWDCVKISEKVLVFDGLLPPDDEEEADEEAIKGLNLHVEELRREVEALRETIAMMEDETMAEEKEKEAKKAKRVAAKKARKVLNA